MSYLSGTEIDDDRSFASTKGHLALRRHASRVVLLCVASFLISAAITWRIGADTAQKIETLRAEITASTSNPVSKQASLDKSLAEISAKSQTGLTLSTALVAGLSVFLLASLAHLHRQLGRPLASLTSALDLLSRGSLSTPDAAVGAATELQKLGLIFSRLRTSLEEKAAVIRELRLFAEFRRWLGMTKTEAELMKVTGEVVERLLPDMKGSLFIMSASRLGLQRARVWNGGAGPVTLGMDDCWSLRSGTTYTYGGGEFDQCCAHAHEHADAYCCVPLRAHGDLVGLLHVELKKQPGSTKETRDAAMTERRRLATACAEHLSLAISNLQLREHMRHLHETAEEKDARVLSELEAEADAGMMVEVERYQSEYVDEEAERTICAVS